MGGGLLGVLVALWANALIGGSIRLGDAGTLALPMNGPVLALAFLVSLLSGLLFGLVPAWLASRGDLVTTLKQQTRGRPPAAGRTGSGTAWWWPRWRWPWPFWPRPRS